MGSSDVTVALGRAVYSLALPPAAVDAIGRWLVTVTAIGALLLPALGPLLDHHFVERQPVHAHVFLGAAPHDHVHSYEYGAHHHPDHGTRSAGTVYLTSNDGLGTVFTDVTPPMNRMAHILPRALDDPASFVFESDRRLLPDESVAPLTHPPRL